MNNKYDRRCPICGGNLRPEARIRTAPKEWKNVEKGELEYTRTVAGAGRGAARVRIKVKEHGGTPVNTYTMYVCPACKIGFHFKDTLPPLPKPQKDYSKMTVREFKRINNCL